MAGPLSFRAEVDRILTAAPDRPWLTIQGLDGATTFTLADLSRRMADYAAVYRQAGLAEGASVLIVLRESLDLFASFFAAVAQGVLPGYYAYPSPKQSVDAFVQSLTHLLSYNDVALVVGFDDVIDVMRATPAVTDRGMHLVNAGQVASQSSPWRPGAAPAQEAFLQFSSGTTGAKKGVQISIPALTNQIDAYAPLLDFDQQSRVVSWLPHYHDMGLIACMLMPFLRQIPIVMMSPFEWVRRPVMLLEAVTAHRGTHVWLPNFALGHLTRTLAGADLGPINLASLRKVVLCSEPVHPDTVQAFVQRFERFGLNPQVLDNCYAMAENTFAMTSTRGGLRFLEVDPVMFQREHRVQAQAGGRRIASAGTPLDNISVRVADPSGASIADGSVGDILIRSNCMLDGYFRNPAATAEAFIEGWFRTGDLGFVHGGELFVTGRRKDMVIVGGENIYPQDLEQILNEEPGLVPGRNVVFGVPDDRVGTEKVVVLAEVAPGGSAPSATHLRARIAADCNVAVADIRLLPHMTLRKGTAGKISRTLNRQAYLDGAFDDTAAPPSGRGTILDIVRTMVGAASRTAIDADTPLLTSGFIDSFAFADLIRRVEVSEAVAIPEQLWTVSNFDSVAAIERVVAACRDHRGGALSAGQASAHDVERSASLQRLKSHLTVVAGGGPVMERIINRFPLRGSVWYRWLFRLAGINVGRDVTFLGRVHVKLRGRPGNITIGDNVILADGVDIRNRENGRIVLGTRVYLDQGVRVIAARDGCVEIGFGTEVGQGTVIVSGGRTIIGEFCMVAGNININSSRHGTLRGSYMKEQAHSHGVIELGDDVWVGSGASILLNTKIGTGAIVASNSLVSGEVPPFAMVAGVPAKVIQYR